MDKDPRTPPQTEQREEEDEIRQFFSFRTMITPALIKVVYPLGIIAIVIGGILYVRSFYFISPGVKFIIFLSFFVVGNLIWRIACEGTILFFSIHEILSSIEKNLKQK